MLNFILGVEAGLIFTIIVVIAFLKAYTYGDLHIIDGEDTDPDLYLSLSKNPNEIKFGKYAIFKVKEDKLHPQK